MQELTLVGTRVLEQDNLALLKEQTRLLREEQVRSLDNILEVRLAVRVDESSDVRDVDSLRTASAGNEDVRLEAQVGAVTEVGSINDDLTRRQLDVLVLNLHEVPVLAQLRSVEVGDRHTEFSQPDELLPIDTLRIGQDAATVDDSDSLVRRQEDLIRAEITIYVRLSISVVSKSAGRQKETHQGHQSAP